MTANLEKKETDQNIDCISAVREGSRFILWFRRLTLLYWLALTYLLLAPDPLWFLNESGGSDDAFAMSLPDLVQHCLAFGLLGALLSFQNRRHNRLGLSLGFAIVYSIGTELIQMYVPGRFASFLDILANFSGLLIGWGIVQFLRRVTLSRGSRLGNVVSP